jgi:hypothetical protein
LQHSLAKLTGFVPVNIVAGLGKAATGRNGKLGGNQHQPRLTERHDFNS